MIPLQECTKHCVAVAQPDGASCAQCLSSHEIQMSWKLFHNTFEDVAAAPLAHNPKPLKRTEDTQSETACCLEYADL